jgi:hypothetical protein
VLSHPPGTSGKAVHTIRVRPVALNSDDVELLFFNQPPRNPDALAVKVVRAMRRLANQYHATVANPLH